MLCTSDGGVARVLAVLLDPVLEVASMAGQRPYLSPEAIITSLEMIHAAVKLVVFRKKGLSDEGERIVNNNNVWVYVYNVILNAQ